jgi:hypothetical protein
MLANRAFRASACVLALLGGTSAPVLGQELAWSETQNLPKGLNLPDGVSLDVLGIAIGDTYETTRARLEALRAEAPDAGPVQEMKTQYFLNTGGGTISAEFVGELRLSRTAPGTGSTSEDIAVRFTAPSSGSQVVAIERKLDAGSQGEQMRLGQLLDAVAAKLGGPADDIGGGRYRYQFDGGRRAAAEGQYECYDFAKTWHDEGTLDVINKDGTCDAVYDVLFSEGISDDHARAVTFTVYDNERAKANLAADYAFFNAYVADYQKSVGGVAPAL